MKKTILAIAFALVGGMTADRAEAFHGPGNVGFVPFGFYQPYGIRYSNTVRTPPYFAVNPPVYYGSRYSRPYGESPFASPPLLSAPAGYQVQPAAQFVRPPAAIGPEICNPYLTEVGMASEATVIDVVAANRNESDTDDRSVEAVGPIRYNPFVAGGELAKDTTGYGVSR